MKSYEEVPVVSGDPEATEVATKILLFVGGPVDEVLRLEMLAIVSSGLAIVGLAVLIAATFSVAVTVAACNIVVSSKVSVA